MTNTYNTLKNWNQPNESQKIIEQQEQIRNLAKRFDELILCSGWHEIIKFAAADVNDAIVEATKTEMPRDVIRWNAKRELLDRIESYILETRKERSRIETPEPEPEEEWVNF